MLRYFYFFFKWEWRLLVDEQQRVAAVSPEQQRCRCPRVCNVVPGFLVRVGM